MITNPNRQAIERFICESFEMSRLAKSCVSREPTKDNAAARMWYILRDNGITHTDCGVPISTTGIRYAMRRYT